MRDAVHELVIPDVAARKLGTTDGGRVLTLILQQTTEPTTWQVITGWDATAAERKMGAR
jgi:hypothetical protein